MPKPTNPQIVEHQALLRTALLAGAMLHPYDIDAALRAIDMADSIGPLLDPTLWQVKHKDMELDRELLEAARPLAALAKKRMAEYQVRYEEELEQANAIADAVIRP